MLWKLLAATPDAGPAPIRSSSRVHLFGGLDGKGDGADGFGGRAIAVDQTGHAVGEHAGLARAGPRQDRDRARVVFDGLSLSPIEPR